MPDATGFEAQPRAEDGTLCLRFDGRLDTEACDRLASAVEQQVSAALAEPARPARVVFDLQGVDFVASAFLRLAVATAKSVPDDGFAIVNVDPFVKRTFKIAGLDRLLHVS